MVIVQEPQIIGAYAILDGLENPANRPADAIIIRRALMGREFVINANIGQRVNRAKDAVLAAMEMQRLLK